MTEGLSLVCPACNRVNPLKARVCMGCATPLRLIATVGDPVFDPAAPTVREEPRRPAAAPAPAPANRPGLSAARPAAPAVSSLSAAAAPARAPSVALRGVGPSAPPAAAAPAMNASRPPARPAANDVPASAEAPCKQCGAPIPDGYKFCGRCGARVEEAAPAPAPGSRTMFFGAMQVPGKAKLILIKGEGLDGVSYHLNATEHLAGRLQGVILFPEDPLMSPAHATFFYKDNKLNLRDEESVNGVFMRIREPIELSHGDHFLVGEQTIRFEVCEDAGPVADETGTFFYASPKRPSAFRLTQILRGGDSGLAFRARGELVTMGREGNDIDFPTDQFISGRHAQVQVSGNRFVLSDLGSKNGTFVRVRDERGLGHGDYVFIGQQLLRVEIT